MKASHRAERKISYSGVFKEYRSAGVQECRQYSLWLSGRGPYTWRSWFRAGALGWGSCSGGKSILVPPYHRTPIPPNSVPSYPRTSVPPRNAIQIPLPLGDWGLQSSHQCGCGPTKGSESPIRDGGQEGVGYSS